MQIERRTLHHRGQISGADVGSQFTRQEEAEADQGTLHFDHPESDSYRSALLYQMNLRKSCPVIEKHRRASGRNGEAKGNVATALKSKATAERDGEKHCPARQWKCIEEPWKSTDQSCNARQCNGMAPSGDARLRNCLDKQRKGDEKKSFDCKGKPQNR